MQIDKKDIKPKIICENCHRTLLSFKEMKKNALDSQVVINYIANKKVSVLGIISVFYIQCGPKV